MNSYSRAYRDPKSPLTPLTPLSENKGFTFNISGDDTLKPFINAVEAERSKQSTKLSPVGVIAVNPNKYIVNGRSAASKESAKKKRTLNSKKLSPHFMPATNKVSGVVGMSSCFDKFSPNHASTSNSLKVHRNSKHSPFLEEISNSSKQNSYNSSDSAWTTTNYSSQEQASTFGACRRASCNSNCSNGSQSSSVASSASSSSRTSITSSGSSTRYSEDMKCSRSSRELNSSEYLTAEATSTSHSRRHIPPKLVFDSTHKQEVDNGDKMCNFFNWVWNQLSPRNNPTIADLLSMVGMQKYLEIFKREEITDLVVFSTLTMADLNTIGIENSKDCVKILECVRMALDFLSGLFVLKKP